MFLVIASSFQHGLQHTMTLNSKSIGVSVIGWIEGLPARNREQTKTSRDTIEIAKEKDLLFNELLCCGKNIKLSM